MTQANAALKEVLDKRVQAEGLRPVSRETGIPLGVVRAILEGRDVSGTNLLDAAEKLGLEFYIGPKRYDISGAEIVGGESFMPTEAADTAYLDRFDLQVSAGPGSMGVATPAEPVPFSARWLRKHGLRPKDISILEVRGDSQEPILFDGDPIIASKHKTKPKSGRLYVVVRPDSVQIKWVTVLRHAFQLVSENPAYPPERVEATEAPDFYPVLWFSHFIRG